MKKHSRLIQCVCCMMFFLFVCGAILQSCIAKTYTISLPAENIMKVSKGNLSNNNYQDHFAFAFFWGTYEERGGALWVYNRGPWYNRTINVIAYVDYEHKFIFKKAFTVDCPLWIGFARLHHVCAIGYDVNAE